MAGASSMPDDGRRSLEAVADVTYVAREAPMTAEDARCTLRSVEVVAVTPKLIPRFDRALLDFLPTLRGLALYATGYDFLDVDLLRRHGVTVSVLPNYATEAVAEHGISLLLGLSCRLHLANDRARGLAPVGVSLRGFELRGQTLGVIGVGRIGGRVAQLARAFGMRTLGFDRRPRRLPGVHPAGLRELLASSDAVMLCCSRDRGAAYVLGRRELWQCRQGAVIVNVGRPGLVDSEAVAELLRSRRLRGYAVDDAVFDVVTHADLICEGRVLQTGHSAWWRDQVLVRGGVMWAEHTRRLAIGDPIDVVNPCGAYEKLAG
jgi:phosphoglycerate dehydrogenase-like enzyme